MIKTALRSIADLVFPRVCVICGCELTLDENCACITCLLELPQTKFSNLSHNPMSEDLNSIFTRLCPDNPLPYAFATALFYYSSTPRDNRDYGNISKDLKYRANFTEGRFFAHKLAEEMSQSALYQDVDLVVPVPLHWTRQMKRGYNQAEVIASEISNSFPLSQCISDILIRNRATKQQTHLNIEDKFKNVSTVFSLNPKRLAMVKKARHILVVDDIFTTGATLSSCVLVLRAYVGFETKVSVATLGYVGQL